MSTATADGEPRFFVLDYITITRDPRTQLVVAIGGDNKAAGILQTLGGFVSAPGPRGPYHRQPHDLPVDQQRRGATAAAHGLLLAGFSVHLDPSLNTLATPDGDRQAALRYLDELAERARQATNDREVAAVLTEITAPHDGLLHRLTQTLVATWAPWTQRLEAAGQNRALTEQLMHATSRLSSHARVIETIRDQAATRPTQQAPASAPTTLPAEPRNTGKRAKSLH
ncbi:hypothetical protein [Streptomyces sp. UNOB3_S3]|uniref:hypothetical protein n=1 Tax=Streptomyces sp. UNOB3_S3 TaxID=2871682 RepID=UPI001E6217D3|nr:hypothetical protein [Streptomyces sp. UNOB3_S3]MCC3778733.1 hypothetical protein [Streptomyces sp. UNOB3_S3]